MKNRKYIDNLKLMYKGISLHSIGIDETAWTAEKLYDELIKEGEGHV